MRQTGIPPEWPGDPNALYPLRLRDSLPAFLVCLIGFAEQNDVAFNALAQHANSLAVW